MYGTELTEKDIQKLAKCYITQDLAERAGIRRVTSAEGSEIVGRNGKPGYEGLIFPYFLPGETEPREYRLRRDHPELERRADGTTKWKNKYMSPPGRGNHIYFPPDIPPDLLEDTEVPVRITEGEKKTLALWRLALYEAERPRFLPIGLSGVWNWRGTVGKETGPNGERLDVKGVISDLDRIEWVDRRVDIDFDANVATNSSVQAARRRLGDELQSRGAQVFYVNIPIEARVNGIDDLLAAWGPERVLELVVNAEPHHLVLAPDDPMRSARELIAQCYMQEGVRTIHYHKNTFYTYTRNHYREVESSEIRSAIYKFLERAKRKSKSSDLVPFRPNKVGVTNVLDALMAVAMHSHEVGIPSWLEGSTSDVPADEILACKNVLLHLPTLQTIQHTPLFFGGAALEFDYDPNAPNPQNWFEFLNQLWPEDPASIGTLQDWFGYCLSTDTRQQKILLVVGPKRSGKGTIARVLRSLLGRENVCAPTLFSLTQNFGLAPLIGKRLGIISDARLDRRADQATIAERLLSISGEDAVTIDRKYRPPWTGTLPTRFMIFTNELPRIADASGAMASRFVVLQLTQSFLGSEDTELTERLLEELPGILNWGIDGWIRLQERGHFVQPESADDTISELEDLASPVSAFIRDECQIEPKRSVSRDALFEAWRGWCEAQARQFPGTKATFGRDLRAAVATIKDERRTIKKKVVRFYTGISWEL